ncbi:MAG: hypothetical protein HY776_04185 [Actinobacteria bacterium]|nr:hypothetical protein [Actinomycetota bacterium]
MKRITLLAAIICMMFSFPLAEAESAKVVRRKTWREIYLERRVANLRRAVVFRDRIIADLRKELAAAKQTAPAQASTTASQTTTQTAASQTQISSPAFAKQETTSYVPAGRTITVFNVQGGIDSATKYYQVTGSVQNTGSTPVYNVRLIVNYYDSSGQVVASNTITPSTTTFQPLESISFSNSLNDTGLSAKVMRHDVQVSWRDNP